jgi:hypothetical protein
MPSEKDAVLGVLLIKVAVSEPVGTERAINRERGAFQQSRR